MEEELEKIKIHIEVPESIKAPIKKRDIVGKVNVFFDGKLIHEEDLVAKESVNKLNPMEKILNKIKN